MVERWITCPKCKGLEVMLSDTGKFISCPDCHGIGIVKSAEFYLEKEFKPIYDGKFDRH